MASNPYTGHPVPNPYPNHNSQNYQQPMAHGVYSNPPYAIANIPPYVYPQQQQQYHPIYQQQQYHPLYQQQQQQQQYNPLYQQQQQHQQLQYKPTTNTFPFDAILFFDDYKPYYEFTNFAKIGFDLDGHYWPTSEHYFQAQKFKDNPSIQYKIRSLPGARDAFEFVREPNNKSLVRKDWAEKKEEIMYNALRAKFSQNDSLRDKLLKTNDRMLVEDSPYDPYWGIGSDKNGKNRLGELLMKLRTELRNTLTTTSHTSSVTQTTLRRSSSLSRLSTPSFPSITDEEIIYEVNDATHFLSNCYPSSLKLEGKDWPTVLHYFVAKKFDLKRHHVSKILSMKDCQEVHLYSRNLRFQSDIVICWDLDKKKVMKQGLKAKFEQNLHLKDKLLNTGGREIIERSTDDVYWSQLADGSGRNLMGQLLCEVRSELNKHLSTPPSIESTPSNSSLSKWKSFENIFPSSPKKSDHTSQHSGSKRLSQTINSPSYKLDNIPAITVNDPSSYISRTEKNSSKNPKTSNTLHFTDFVDTGVYDKFSTYSTHSFNLDGKYWKSVQHYFQAQKYSSTEWLVNDIRTALTSKLANEIGKDKVYRKNIVKNWDSIREGVMLRALKAKFRKYYNLKDTLLATGDRQIVNDSEDEYWGCGKDGKGRNTLGMLLMIVRTECLNTVVSTKPSSQPNHTNTSYSHPSSPLKGASNNDVIEFFDKDKPYFEFTPYSRHTVRLDDISWKSLNHYFQAQKFTSNNEKRKIADASTPDRATYLANNELKKLSKSQTFNQKEITMKKGLEAKFRQHPDLRRMLLDTGTKKLLFMHPKDLFWGTGTTELLGQNKLGKLLTKLRLKLSIPTASSDPIYNPVNIQHTDSSSDDNITQLGIVIRHDNTGKSYSIPLKQVTSQRRPYFSILMILVLIITVLMRYFGI